jgi:hypothetical protein
MANNYLQFAKSICNLTSEERAWFEEALREPEEGAEEGQETRPWFDEEGLVDFSHDFIDETILHLYSEESGNIDAVADLLCAFLKRFRPNDVETITWATTCSKMRDGEFSGGAVVVTAEAIRGFSADEWARQREDEFASLGTLSNAASLGALDELIAERRWTAETLSGLLREFLKAKDIVGQFHEFVSEVAKGEREWESGAT